MENMEKMKRIAESLKIHLLKYSAVKQIRETEKVCYFIHPSRQLPTSSDYKIKHWRFTYSVYIRPTLLMYKG
jgi:hypothetical protein